VPKGPPLVTSQLLIEPGLQVEGPAPAVLQVIGQAIRDELHMAIATRADHNTLAMRCLVRIQLRLGSAGYMTRQIGDR